MHCRPAQRRPQGFTLVELLVIIVLIGVVATLGIPNFQRLVQRAKLEGFARETAVLMKRARSEAIRQNVPAIVRADLVTNEVVAFVDVHGAAITDPSDSLFNPIAGQPHRTTDWELARYRLPSLITFEGPIADPAPIDQFTPIAGEQIAIFNPSGSIQTVGALRFADIKGNFLEVRVAPQATSRVQVRKWDDDDNTWKTRNEGGEPWTWN